MEVQVVEDDAVITICNPTCSTSALCAIFASMVAMKSFTSWSSVSMSVLIL